MEGVIVIAIYAGCIAMMCRGCYMLGYRKGYKKASGEAVEWINGGGIGRAFEDGYQQYRAHALASDALLGRQGKEGV